ncbi:MAG: ABC transporter substrate-binding protein [Elusimicrobiota bacterium]
MRSPKSRYLLLSVCALVMAACGPRTESGAQQAGKKTIRFIGKPTSGGGWKVLIEEFEAKNPDIDIEVVEGPSDTTAREDLYTTAFLSGKTPYDLIYMDVAWVAKFSATGWLRPLDDLFSLDRQKEFLPGDVMGSRFEGKTYRVPLHSDAGMLYYRKDLLASVKETAPRTWDDLLRIAKKLQKPPQLLGYVFQGKQYEGLSCNFYEFVWGAGGSLQGPDGKLTVNSPAAVEALGFLSSLPKEHAIAPVGVTTYQEEEARHLFQEGRAVFMRNWPYAWVLMQKEGSPVKGKIGIIPMVHKQGAKSGATLGGWGFGIATAARYPQEAWRFVDFITSAVSQKRLNQTEGFIPTRKALFKDPDMLKANPYYPDLYEILLVAKPRPQSPKYTEISNILQARISAVLVGQASPQAALDEAQRKIEQVLAR